jgi:hypothetical protein
MRRLILATVLVLVAGSAQAQTLTNPSAIQFDSADHNAVAGGQPLLTAYTVTFFQSGATVATTTVDVPKATAVLTPGTTATYTIPFSALPAYPLGTVFVAKIASKGPGGSSATLQFPESFTKPVPAPAPVTNGHIVP